MEQTTESSQPAEGLLVMAIETETTRPPADTFLTAAVGSMALSLGLQLFGRRMSSRFIGQWVPILLLFGLYNRMSKLADRQRSGLRPQI